MSVVFKTVDPRGFAVVLTHKAAEHIVEEHPEFANKLDEWCKVTVEAPVTIRTNPKYPGQEKYEGPAIARGFTTGDTPVVAVRVGADQTRMIVTAWTTSLRVHGEQLWPVTGDKRGKS